DRWRGLGGPVRARAGAGAAGRAARPGVGGGGRARLRRRDPRRPGRGAAAARPGAAVLRPGPGLRGDAVGLGPRQPGSIARTARTTGLAAFRSGSIVVAPAALSCRSV